MRRRICSVVFVAAALSVGLGVTAASATDDGAQPSRSQMGSMMAGSDMNAMHASMREQMQATMPADVLAACDAAHAAMSAQPETMHAAHQSMMQP